MELKEYLNYLNEITKNAKLLEEKFDKIKKIKSDKKVILEDGRKKIVQKTPEEKSLDVLKYILDESYNKKSN